ncbi:MAG: PD-(D/E)XK nuclease family protein, partial [Candidatus Ratteibacteria bacterium]|nr:PD-(D/E)XK nuclease family protein [Candidatus Ratteibacteria bacterium]
MQILTVPFELPFLRVLAKYIYQKHLSISPDFGRILIVFPSERNKLYFREYLLCETGKEAIVPPNLLTTEQLYDYIFEKAGGVKLSLAEEIERNVLLKKATEELKAKNLKELSFVKFISIGRKLLAFFDELTSWGLQIKDIENVKEKLHFPSRYIDEELPILKKINERYKKNLKAEGLTDTASAHLSIAENFKSGYLEHFESIYIAGCLALTLTDISLIKKILEQVPAELIIHCDKENLTDNSLENVFYHHNKILGMLNADIENIQTLCPENFKHNKPSIPVYIQKCKNTLDEVSFIISTLSELSFRYALNRIGIILPDEPMYLPLKDALEKFNIPYNLSMGIPFKHTFLYSFLKDTCDFIDSNFSSETFLVLLKNPAIKGIVKDKIPFKDLAYELDGKIRKENLSRISRETELPGADILTDYIFDITDKLSRNCSFGEYLKTLREIIQELAELNNKLYKKISLILNDLTVQLINIENSKIPGQFCPKGKDKLKFIMSILQTISFPVSGDFLNGVQVIGILEARNIDFDSVIIPSCNEGIFPKKSDKDLFLPANLRKEVALPFYKERDALYSYYFHQLITGKKEVYLSYRSEEKTQFGLKNRWIEELIEGNQKHFTVTENEETNSATLRRLYTGKGKDKSYGKKSSIAYKNQKTLNSLKYFTFSPSILKTFKLCPYKFYLSYVLNMREPKSITEEYEASIWGKIFHNALARLYNEKYPGGYTKNIKKQVIGNSFKIGEEEFKKAYPQPKAALCFDWERNKERMKNLIDMEIAHFEEGFKPMEIEKGLRPYTIDIHDKLKIKIGGIPDRIDVRKGKFYIIDYKIGNKPDRKTYEIGKDFTEFQLPLYGLTYAKGDTEKIVGLIYYHLDENLRDFTKLDILKEEGENYVQQFKKSILLPTLK